MSEPKLYRILQVTFISIIVALLVASAFLFASGSRVRRWHRTACDALHEHDYATAITHYERYLHERPFDDDAWGDLAQAYFHVGRHDECIMAIRRYGPGGAFWIEPGKQEEIRRLLIRYVECVKAGRESGEDPPRFFCWHAPSERSR